MRTLGVSYIGISKYKEALQYLQEALFLLEILNDDYGRSDVYEYFGIAERSFGNYENSLKNLFKSLELRQNKKYIKYKEGESF